MGVQLREQVSPIRRCRRGLPALAEALQREPGVRLSGARRLAARQRHQAGVDAPVDLWARSGQYAREGSPLLTQRPGSSR